MTTAQFIAAVEAKPNFIKWAKQPVAVETLGEVEKHHGVAYITTPDGTNTYNVWFMVDTATGEANWQNFDTMTPEANTLNAKMNALTNYLKSNFHAYFIGRYDLNNNWAEADTYKLVNGNLQMTKVMVFKVGNNPIQHLNIV